MLNKVQLIGYVGRDPELRYTPQGKAIARFSLAVTRRTRDAQGQRQETTQWFPIVAWERLAETCDQYVRKGAQIYLEGRMASRSFIDPDGHARTSWEVIASDLQLLGKSGSASSPERRNELSELDASDDAGETEGAGVDLEPDATSRTAPSGHLPATTRDTRTAQSARYGVHEGQWPRRNDTQPRAQPRSGSAR